MAWIPRGKDEVGRLQDGSLGQTPSVPAVATHRGELWCLWSDVSGNLYYAIGDNEAFQPRNQFPDQGMPVIAELTGMLHAIIIKDSGDMVHWVFDDLEQLWMTPAALNRDSGFFSHAPPALVAFQNKLVLVFIQESMLYYSLWTINHEDGTSSWKYPQEVSGIKEIGGIPALFVLEGILHVVCESKDESREILGFAYGSIDDVWNSCGDVSEGKAASGVSATSFGASAFLAFMEDGPGDASHVIYISEFRDGKWMPQEAVGGQASADPPQLAILNGRINCIFNSNDERRELRWYSRSLLDFSLSSWMGEIPDDTLLSNLTIPGTHDSCATSNIPFVRTQYLSITKQLEAGLRFFDLRCRAHADGQLYMYHGGIPINLPRYLKLETVMNEIFTFFEKNHTAPTETVLISINNDDTSLKKDPTIFYNAVKSHIETTPRYPDNTSRWITSTTTSTLGSSRGRTVLLRRYQHPEDLSPEQGIGIDLSGWLNNNPDFTLQTPSNVQIMIQDHWQYISPLPLEELILSKLSYVVNMFSKSRRAGGEEWFLNFTSAVGVPSLKGEVAESHWIAVGGNSKYIGRFVEGVNRRVLEQVGEWKEGKERLGVVAMDYPELPKGSDLVAKLVELNL